MFEQIPRPLFLLGTTAKIDVLGKTLEKDNLMTLDWFMPLSKEPAMCAIAVKTTRLSYKMIKQSGVFSLNLMPVSKRKEVAYCGEHSGEFLDKFEKTKLTRTESSTIHCCAVKEAMLSLECEVIEEVGTGDHALFISKITKESKGDLKKSPLIHYRKDYAKLVVEDAKK